MPSVSKAKTVPVLTPDQSGRFWAKIDKRGDACWPWLRALYKNGYGQVGFGHDDKFQAHRVAYSLAVGPIPSGMCVCHSCDNRKCCNPAHLFLGTPADNLRDMRAKGRGNIGERNGGNKLSRSQVGEIASLCREGRESQLEIARQFGVSQSTVSNIALGKKWKCLTLVE